MRRVGLAVAAVVLIGAAALGWSRMRAADALTQRLVAASEARKSGHFNEAENELAGLPAELKVSLERAEIRLARGDLPGAHAILKAEAATAPEDLHFWARYGFTAAVLGDLEVAKSALTRAATGSPAEADAATHLVQLIQREDPTQARARVQALEAQSVDPAAKAIFHAAATE